MTWLASFWSAPDSIIAAYKLKQQILRIAQEFKIFTLNKKLIDPFVKFLENRLERRNVRLKVLLLSQ